jgi:hypothetical protein
MLDEMKREQRYVKRENSRKGKRKDWIIAKKREPSYMFANF